MKKNAIIGIIVLFTLLLLPTRSIVSAQDNHTAREEAEGKEIWNKFQAKQLECKDLTNDDYAALGEYFMGQMAGPSHEVMNNMMVRMMGEGGERQMHIALGKRSSGCDTRTKGGENSMMGYGGWGNMMGWGFGILGWFFMIIFWVLIILGVVALIRYLAHSGQSKEDKTPLDILKERYARGEINKKEFEEKKKELS